MRKEESFYLVASLYFSILLAVIVTGAASWNVSGTVVGGFEDVLLVYNLTDNVTSSSWSEGLSFTILNISAVNTSGHSLGLGSSPSNYPWITLGASTGILTINSTRNNQSASFTMFIGVSNSSGSGGIEPFYFNITPVNDAPRIIGLTNKTVNMTYVFSIQNTVYDEESDSPYNLNITFLSCDVAEWSDRDCGTEDGRELFNESYYTFNNNTGVLNITFTPGRNDVGSYMVRFNVSDSGNSFAPLNNSYSQDVNFTVNVINSVPYFRYICDDEREATENSVFECYVNVTDTDETNNITFRSLINGSRTWFTFFGASNIYSVPTNVTTQFNASALVNFTASDIMVGNWSVNITINDTGSPTGINSTAFFFFIDNVEDPVSISSIDPITVYTSNNYSNDFVIAYDDDLLVPDKNEKNEQLTFYTNDSRVYIQTNNTVSNRTIGRIIFNGSDFTEDTFYINVTVNDSSNLHTNSTLLTLNVIDNSAPVWNEVTPVNYTLNEGISFYLNLTTNVTDSDNDPLNFTFVNYTYFPSFSLNKTTGIINLTPVDADVGRHSFLINVTDGRSSLGLSFTFLVNNLNESPYILNNSFNFDNVTGTLPALFSDEDSFSRIYFYIDDEDFRIQNSQKAYYNESLNVSLSYAGPNTNLLNLSLENFLGLAPNRSQYLISYTPNKSDVGFYNIYLNVTDRSGNNTYLNFNLTISDINHNPSLSQELNKTSSINRTLTFNLNGSDIEDGFDNSSNFTYTYDFLNDGITIDFIDDNETIFNSTNGLFNYTFNDSQFGTYHLNFTLMDFSGRNSSMHFYIFVYDIPVIISPNLGDNLNLTENTTSILSFNATHTIGNNLSFAFYLNNSLRYTRNGSSSLLTNWSFTPNFTDETFGETINLTLFVSNIEFPDLNASRVFNANISHKNAPLLFNQTIPNQQKNTDQLIILDLESYFTDIDSSDYRYNQSLNFIVSSNMSENSTVVVSYSNGSIANSSLTMSFSSSSVTQEVFNITATDSQYQVSSNLFTLEFTTPTVTGGQSSQSSGGGGSSTVRPVALNILVPGPLTARKFDKLIVPIQVVNDGSVTLNDIFLRNFVAKNGIAREDLVASFDRSTIDSLSPGESENLTLIVDVDTNDPGLYEITLNGTSTSPRYTDVAKLYVNVEEGDRVSERISFTEELFAQNPQCIEISEIVEEARRLYVEGRQEEAQAKTEEAIAACQRAISQSASLQRRKQLYNFAIDNAGIITLGALFLGIGYYWFRRLSIQRAMIRGEEPGF